jgi:hypothetical protein
MARAYSTCSGGNASRRPRPVLSNAELDNDPSLRWAPRYTRGEAVHSDAHGTTVRFGSYNDDGTVSLLNLVLGPLPGTFARTSVRRVSAR